MPRRPRDEINEYIQRLVVYHDLVQHRLQTYLRGSPLLDRIALAILAGACKGWADARTSSFPLATIVEPRERTTAATADATVSAQEKSHGSRFLRAHGAAMIGPQIQVVEHLAQSATVMLSR